MSKDPRKEALKKAWKEQERKKLIDSIPMPQQDLRDLFDYLDREETPPCDHTYKTTLEFLQKRSLDPARIVPWLQQHGGHCDCEVLANVESEFGDILEK